MAETTGVPELLAAESLALTVALTQTLRGEAPDLTVTTVCVLALARITGRHDWVADLAEDGQGEEPS